MKITLTEAEAHYHILRSLGLADDVKMARHSSGVFIITNSPHSVDIVPGVGDGLKRPVIGTIDG